MSFRVAFLFRPDRFNSTKCKRKAAAFLVCKVQAAATDLRAEFVRIGAQYAIENPEETAEQRIRELNEDIESQEKQLNKANRALGNLKKYTEGTNETD
ncbi:hypothetical protein QR680_007229 [Steinernema hermaphroditum]|uniref:Uncharacterized protein n=1 Tax=Steinernema hermaphroditum TaxID=289476 RepID=A0AA39I0N8_9BILA|nr:hypothetical protein QR680_007229 [Steinernema hermaphroditum]